MTNTKILSCVFTIFICFYSANAISGIAGKLAGKFLEGAARVLGAESAKYIINVIKEQNSIPSRSESSNPITPNSPIRIDENNIHYNTYKNIRFGFEIPYPNELLQGQGEPENGDGQVFLSSNRKAVLAANATLMASDEFEGENAKLDALSNSDESVKITYRRRRNDFFVISGFQNNGNTIFYLRRHNGEGCSKGFLFTYPVSERAVWDKVVTKISLRFNPNSPGIDCQHSAY